MSYYNDYDQTTYNGNSWDGLNSTSIVTTQPRRTAGVITTVKPDPVVKEAPTRDQRIKQRSLAMGMLAEQIAELEARPEEPKGTLITFSRTFNGGSKRYRYAGQRVKNLWYLTGSTAPQGMTWDELIDWLEDDLVWMEASIKRERVKF